MCLQTWSPEATKWLLWPVPVPFFLSISIQNSSSDMSLADFACSWDLICVLLCAHMCALMCVLSYVCSPVCSHICALPCALVCALMCVLSCQFKCVCPHVCGLVCLLLCALTSVLSWYCVLIALPPITLFGVSCRDNYFQFLTFKNVKSYPQNSRTRASKSSNNEEYQTPLNAEQTCNKFL